MKKEKSRGKKKMKLLHGLLGAAAAVVAGAYLLGKFSGEEQKEEPEDDQVKLVKIKEPVKEESIDVSSVSVKPKEMEIPVEEPTAPKTVDEPQTPETTDEQPAEEESGEAEEEPEPVAEETTEESEPVQEEESVSQESEQPTEETEAEETPEPEETTEAVETPADETTEEAAPEQTENPVEEIPVEEEEAEEEPETTAEEEPVSPEPAEEETETEETPETEEPVEETTPEETETPAEESDAEEETAEEIPVEQEQPEETEEEIPVEEEEVRYPHVTDRKVESIRKQIGTMMEQLNGQKEVHLIHYVRFSDQNKAESFAQQMELVGFHVEKDEANPAELHLEQDTAMDRNLLEKTILTLADEAALAGGNYRGWAIRAK